jgi:cytochrome c oxidase subunit IV
MSKLLFVWVALLALLGLEIGASFLHLNLFVLVPALAMLAIVVVAFMQIGRGPTIVRVFAAAGLLWLLILLTLGSLDPLTRINYPVEQPTAEPSP